MFYKTLGSGVREMTNPPGSTVSIALCGVAVVVPGCLTAASGFLPAVGPAASGMLASQSVTRRSHRVLDGATGEGESDVLPAVAAAIEVGSDINAVKQQGNTALHSAALQGFSRVVELLVSNGAALNVKNTRGQTPLTAAMTVPNPSQTTVDILRKSGATE